jgi:cytoskeletal protein RodZ
MKGIGEIIKEARTRKKISFAKLASITRIRKEFIEALEKENWEVLPEYPVVTGFIKNVARALGINVNTAVATLRRDYPRRELRINPKPDVSKEFVWSPKLTFLAGIVAVFLGVFGYLIVQYISFVSPPKLIVDVPEEGQVVTAKNVKVEGNTNPEATLKINNQPVLLNEDGHFSTDIEVFGGTKEVTVVAKSRSGKESTVTRKIEVNLGVEQ